MLGRLLLIASSFFAVVQAQERQTQSDKFAGLLTAFSTPIRDELAGFDFDLGIQARQLLELLKSDSSSNEDEMLPSFFASAEQAMEYLCNPEIRRMMPVNYPNHFFNYIYNTATLALQSESPQNKARGTELMNFCLLNDPQFAESDKETQHSTVAAFSYLMAYYDKTGDKGTADHCQGHIVKLITAKENSEQAIEAYKQYQEGHNGQFFNAGPVCTSLMTLKTDQVSTAKNEL
ncbi:MAG: hypothetical protein K0S29_385 [Gammaproteobacteria bacterium]|jgi:hypothetical protein|nr:hypothetical protein [Gammaproteobacteria bacterium]